MTENSEEAPATDRGPSNRYQAGTHGTAPVPEEASDTPSLEEWPGIIHMDLIRARKAGVTEERLAEVLSSYVPLREGEAGYDEEPVTAGELLDNLGHEVVHAWAKARTDRLIAFQLSKGKSLQAMVNRELKGWQPADIRRVLAEGEGAKRPTILSRTDGLCLLYAGETHAFNGESGKGKSWLAQWAAAEVLKTGGRVLYVDYESNERSVTWRLVTLGVPTDALIERFVYVSPDATPEGAGFEALLTERFDLAVVDGVTEALAKSGLNGESLTNNNDAVTRWHAMLPERIAKETGAAVVQVDHVTKSRDSRGQYAIGAQAKRSAITAASYIVVPRQSFGRGAPGYFDLYVAKDREGYVQGALEGADTEAGRLVCRVHVEPMFEGLRLRLEPPTVHTEDERDTALMRGICDFLATLPEDHKGAGVRLIRDNVPGNDARKKAALDELVVQGCVSRRVVNQSQLHKLIKRWEPRPTPEADDPALYNEAEDLL